VDVETGAQHDISKLWVLPHWQAAFVCRGLQLTAQTLFGALTHPGVTFDIAYEHMSGIARLAQDEMLQRAPLPAGVAQDEATVPNVVMVAWREGRICARVWNGFIDGQLPVYDIPAGRSYLTPSDDAGEIDAMKCSTAADMETVARRQCAIFREQAAARGERPPALGGWLHLAHVSESGIRIERRCDLNKAPARPRPIFSIGLAHA
jgi:hypothetical protein